MKSCRDRRCRDASSWNFAMALQPSGLPAAALRPPAGANRSAVNFYRTADKQSMPMLDADDVLRRLLSAEKIGRASLASVPTEQGVYALWLAGEPPACLKVGIAGPRQGKGLRARLRNHYGSHSSNSVLARHLAADCASRWSHARNFTDRAQRQAFIAGECYFQAVAVATQDRRELEQVEAAIIERLQPTYVGRVGAQPMPRAPSPSLLQSR